MVTKLESKGAGSLSASEAMELPQLYQTQLSSLAVARNSVLDKSLLEYLENLSLRAYLAVYGPRERLGELMRDFLASGFPQAVRSLKVHVLISALIFITSILAGLLIVLSNHEYYQSIVPSSAAQGRDYSSTAQELRDDELFTPWEGFEDNFIHFASFLFRHNTNVSLLCFGLGFCLGIPTILLLFANGLTIGAMLALHIDKGLGLDFIAWLSIHGVTELSAVVLSAAAGLAIGEKVAFPGRLSRAKALSAQGLIASKLMLGAILMLLIAGILEGGFRQLISDTPGRLAVAFITAILWLLYFVYAGRGSSSNKPPPVPRPAREYFGRPGSSGALGPAAFSQSSSSRGSPAASYSSMPDGPYRPAPPVQYPPGGPK